MITVKWKSTRTHEIYTEYCGGSWEAERLMRRINKAKTLKGLSVEGSQYFCGVSGVFYFKNRQRDGDGVKI